MTPPAAEKLFTARFFTMWVFSFTVFLSVFQLLPTAPFHIKDLGGSTLQAGLFLGLLTFSSAMFAPLTGAIGDRIGQRTILLVSSAAIACITLAYAFMQSVPSILALVFVQGFFWSGMLSASSAYMLSIIPVARRAEGLGYAGMASIFALALAPTIGFAIYRRGWFPLAMTCIALNVLMFLIATMLGGGRPAGPHPPLTLRSLIEPRIMLVAGTLFLYSFGYGGITSFAALYADAAGVTPRSIYLTTLAIAILLARPTLGRLGDRYGYKRVFVPCLGLVAAGLGIMALTPGRTGMIVSALTFGVGFGLAYPAFAAYVMQHVDDSRRGAAFGTMIAAFDTGIGSGSTTMGWLIQRSGYSAAFGLAAVLAACAVPYFLAVDRRLAASGSDKP
ncbi:MAG: MFS transporter [Acidobacteriota bacterium]|nr:MFS transporter [Acidobacteriota bacterium]